MKKDKFVILCVDDDADTRDTLKIILESNGYDMIGAASAEEGLKKFKAKKPDFLLIDLMMETVDAGTDLAMKLKAEGNTAPVYMLSSVGDELNLSVSHEQLGLAGVFQKPINPDILLKTLKARLK